MWDLVGRLESIALEIESATSPVFVVAHEEHCRSLRAFLVRQLALAYHDREKVDSSFLAAPLQLLEFEDDNSTGFIETVVDLS